MDKATGRSNEPKRKPPSPDDNRLNAYLRYSGIAFQAILIILAGAFGGKFLDRYFAHETPWVTATGIILSTILALYHLIKQLTR